MPFYPKYKKYNKYKRRFKKKQEYGAPIGKPPRMTRSLRIYNNLTRDCRWFKDVKFITSHPINVGRFNETYRPGQVNECLDFLNWSKCFEQFKVLQMTVHFIPAAIGSESLQQNFQPDPGDTGFPSNIATFKRGEVICYADQGEQDPTEPDFRRIIVKGSARLYSARQKFKRYLIRPNGYPVWGNMGVSGGVDEADSWTDSFLTIAGQNFTALSSPGNQLWYYVQINYKVLFRGRQRAVPPPTLPISPVPPSPTIP